MFTFLPSFARGTGLTIEQMGQVLTLRDLTGLGAPAMGRLADRKGTGPVMAFTSLLVGAGLLLSVFSTIGLLVGFVVMGIGKIGYDVALNAWVGDEVSYDRRARAFGLLELTWAAAALVGIPLCGLLIDRISWRAAPVALGIASLLIGFRVRQVVDRPTIHPDQAKVRPQLTPRVMATLFGLGSLTLTSQLLFVSHGIWLEDAFGLTPSSVGSVVIVFGLIEVTATLTTTAITDRLGKRNAVLLGGVLLLFGTTVLARMTDPSLASGLILLGIAFLGFEFAFVSSLPLVAELDPKARAQIIGLFLGFGTVIRAAGSLIGTMLYVGGGISRVMTLGAISTAVSLVIVILFVREPVTTNPSSEVLN